MIDNFEDETQTQHRVVQSTEWKRFMLATKISRLRRRQLVQRAKEAARIVRRLAIAGRGRHADQQRRRGSQLCKLRRTFS